MDKAIIVDHLSYLEDLKDISFTIQRGEFVGIVGANGSGKTTILKVISGLLKPSSGFVSVLEHDPFLRSHDYLKEISFITERGNQLLKNSPAIDALEITKEIYDLSDREYNLTLKYLTQFIKDPLLLDSLIYKPKVLLLDQPEVDLDTVYNYHKKEEPTILLSSDRIDNLIDLVRRIILIDKGRVLFDGAIDEIVTKFAAEKIIKATLSEEVDSKDMEIIGSVKKYVFPQVYIAAPRSVASLAAAELLQNFPITKLSIEEPSVEEIIENMKAWFTNIL